MCHLAGEVADGVLLNWLTPEHARTSAEWVRAGAAAAQRRPPRLAAYVRVAVGPRAPPGSRRRAPGTTRFLPTRPTSRGWACRRWPRRSPPRPPPTFPGHSPGGSPCWTTSWSGPSPPGHARADPRRPARRAARLTRRDRPPFRRRTCLGEDASGGVPMSEAGHQQLPFGADDLRLPDALRGPCAPTWPRSGTAITAAAGAGRSASGADPR